MVGADESVYMVTFAQDHPMHLHGHDFWVLGSVYGNLDASMTNGLTLVNTPRRDVVTLPASGYVVIAMTTNTPSVSNSSMEVPHGMTGVTKMVIHRSGLCIVISRGILLKALPSSCWSESPTLHSIITPLTQHAPTGRSMSRCRMLHSMIRVSKHRYRATPVGTRLGVPSYGSFICRHLIQLYSGHLKV